MKTRLLITLIVFASYSITLSAQSVWFEQDVRLIDKKPALFYTQIKYTQHIGKTGIAIAPYLATSYDWHEGLAFVNYTKGIFSCGIGAGLEANKNFSELGFRWSPWICFTPNIFNENNGGVEFLSQWEFGKGTGILIASFTKLEILLMLLVNLVSYWEDSMDLVR